MGSLCLLYFVCEKKPVEGYCVRIQSPWLEMRCEFIFFSLLLYDRRFAGTSQLDCGLKTGEEEIPTLLGSLLIIV